MVAEKNDPHPVRSIITTSNNSTDITKDTEVAVIDKTGLPKMQNPLKRKNFTSNNIPLTSIRKEEVGAAMVVAGQEAETRSGVVANHPPSLVGTHCRENPLCQTATTLSVIMTTPIDRPWIETSSTTTGDHRQQARVFELAFYQFIVCLKGRFRELSLTL